MFDQATIDEISRIAVDLGVEPAALLAVAKVESGGRAFANVNGAPMPLIRWEGHYFYKHLPEDLRRKAERAGLAAPNFGVVKNPKTQTARYNLLARASKIHEAAALKSCSWGLGQVMGANAEWIGYGDVFALVADAKSGIPGQVRVMAAFIRKNNLVDELQALNWASFARQYNGPSYKVNKYDTKMAQAYAEFGGTSVSVTGDPMFLRLGDSGAEVREMQVMLRRAGYPLIIDGDFGPASKQSVMGFQRDNGLEVDGIVGPATWSALDSIAGRA